MENKFNMAVAVGGILIAAASLVYTWHTRNQDKGAELVEKLEASIQSIKVQQEKELKAHQKELQQHEKEFQRHLLQNQKEINQLRSELQLTQQKCDHLQKQFEWVDSKYSALKEKMK